MNVHGLLEAQSRDSQAVGRGKGEVGWECSKKVLEK